MKIFYKRHERRNGDVFYTIHSKWLFLSKVLCSRCGMGDSKFCFSESIFWKIKELDTKEEAKKFFAEWYYQKAVKVDEEIGRKVIRITIEKN